MAASADNINRLVLGALAGMAATVAMTSLMRRAYEHLPPEERYPLPPREITERVLPRDLPGSERHRRTLTVSAHFGYGALVGAFYGLIRAPLNAVAGGIYGILVWLDAYLGWVPMLGILKSARRHPARRNSLMIAAHLLWGVLMSRALKELMAAEQGAFASGPLRDRMD